jgi:hypothetical protein
MLIIELSDRTKPIVYVDGNEELGFVVTGHSIQTKDPKICWSSILVASSQIVELLLLE